MQVDFGKQTVPDRGSVACLIRNPRFIICKHGSYVGLHPPQVSIYIQEILLKS